MHINVSACPHSVSCLTICRETTFSQTSAMYSLTLFDPIRKETNRNVKLKIHAHIKQSTHFPSAAWSSLKEAQQSKQIFSNDPRFRISIASVNKTIVCNYFDNKWINFSKQKLTDPRLHWCKLHQQLLHLLPSSWLFAMWCVSQSRASCTICVWGFVLSTFLALIPQLSQHCLTWFLRRW